MTDEYYNQWLAARRAQVPPATLTDQIMQHVVELERQRQDVWWLRIVQLVEHSPARRWAVCGGALAVGSLPFVYLAHVAQFVIF